MQYLEQLKQYVQPGQVFQIGLIVRALAIVLNLGLFAQFTSNAEAASGDLAANLKHLYTYGATLGRLGFDLVSLPLVGAWAYALLVEGAVDYSDRWVQIAAYGAGILSVVAAVFALFVAGGYLTSLDVAEPVETLTLTLQGVFPQLAQLIPAAGFAWLAWDSNVEVVEEEEDAELDA